MTVELGSAWGKIEIDTSGINRAVASAQSAMSGFQGKMQATGKKLVGVGKTLTKSVTLPIIGIGVAMAKVASDFESQLKVMEIAARNSGAEMEDLRKFALKMGADTFFSASEAADAMTGLFKAGLDAEQVMGDMSGKTGVLAAAMDLAAASGLDLGVAADAVTVAMATFGLESDQATVIANSFVQAADASVAEVEDLTAAMVNIGPTAAAFGFSLEDVNTALALLSERGIKGSEAGTALKSMMTNIMRPTDDVREVLTKLNIQLFDTEGAMLSLPEIVDQLTVALGDNATATNALGGATEEQTNAWEKASEALPKLRTRADELSRTWEIADQELQEFRETTEATTLQIAKKELAVDKLRNRLDEANQKLREGKEAIADYEIATQTASTAITSMTEQQRLEAIQTLAGTFGMKAMNTLLAEGTEGWNEMEGAISEAATAQEIGEARMDTFAGAVESLKGSIETFMIEVGTPLIEDFLLPAVEWITETINKLQDLDPRIVKWGIAIAGVLAVAGPLLIIVGQIMTAIAALTPIITALGGVLAVLTGPIGLVVAAIGLLAVAWAKDWGGIREKTARAVEFIGDIFEELVRMAHDVWAGIKSGLSKLGDIVHMITHPFETGVKAVKSLLGIASESKVFKEIGNAIGEGLVAGLEDNTPQVIEVMDELTRVLQAGMITASDELRTEVKSLGFGIAEDLSVIPLTFWHTVEEALAMSRQAKDELAQAMEESFIEPIQQVVQQIAQTAPAMQQAMEIALVEPVQQAVGAVKKNLDDVLQAMIAQGKKLPPALALIAGGGGGGVPDGGGGAAPGGGGGIAPISDYGISVGPGILMTPRKAWSLQLKSLSQRIQDLIYYATQFPLTADWDLIGRLQGRLADMQIEGFARGGIVPGPIGQPQNIIAHGGEIVAPMKGFIAPLIEAIEGPMRQMADSIRPNMGSSGIPPWAYSKGFTPPAPSPISRGGAGKGFTPPGRSVSQRGGDIVINLDGREIARVASPYLADELQQRGIRALA